jgi:hypothetical protein
MRALVIVAALALALAFSLTPAFSTPVDANACASFPSSDCPAGGVPRGALSYPCYRGQVKADWFSMRYYEPSDNSYAKIGSGSGTDVWCFDYAEDAQRYGFSS